MTYTEDQIKFKNQMYNDAEDVLRRMLNVCQKVRYGEFEAAACRQEGIDNIRFRSFIRSNWVCDDARKKTMYDNISYSWRENFIKEVYGNLSVSMNDFDDAYNYILSTLSDKERIIIKLRFEEELSLEDIGNELQLSRERVRQILNRTIRRLNVKSRKMVFEKGVEYVEALNDLKETEKRYKVRVNEIKKIKARTLELNKQLDNGLKEEDIKILVNQPIKIEDIDLSVRAKNSLKRGGVVYLNDLAGYGNKDFLKFRNLGKKSLDEVRTICEEYGIVLKDE